MMEEHAKLQIWEIHIQNVYCLQTFNNAVFQTDKNPE